MRHNGGEPTRTSRRRRAVAASTDGKTDANGGLDAQAAGLTDEVEVAEVQVSVLPDAGRVVDRKEPVETASAAGVESAVLSLARQLYVNQLLPDMEVDDIRVSRTEEANFIREIWHVLPQIGMACCLAASVHIARCFFAGRRPCDHLKKDEQTDVVGHRNSLLLATGEEAAGKRLDVLYRSFTAALTKDTSVLGGAGFPDLWRCWDAVILGVDSFNFTTVKIIACRCVPIMPGFVRRSYIPIDEVVNPPDSFDSVSQICEDFFADQRTRCQDCGATQTIKNLVLDRLPLYLMVAWPHGGPQNCTHPTPEMTKSLAFSYSTADGKTLQAEYHAVKAFLMQGDGHAYAVLNIGGGRIILKDGFFVKGIARHFDLVADAVKWRGGNFGVAGVLLQRRL